jgi:hypothetical protein
MSNMMPGDNSGAEPREHDDRCAALCDVDTERCTIHNGHACNCDNLAEQDAEREAEAYAEYLYDREP